MSKSKGKMRATPSSPKKSRNVGAQRKARKNVAKNSTIIFWVTGIILIVLFVGRWVVAIGNGYFSSFVQLDASTATAVGNMKDLYWNTTDAAKLLPLQKEWDLFSSSRLRDEVETTASDGTALHGYLYNEGADVTVLVLPRFYNDGTADFLPASSLYALTGCNLLLPDPRCHGESGGEYFTYGLQEQYDILAWLDWAEANLGPQTFILWGEGTGANTALMAAAAGILPDSVAFIAAESPYASLHEMAESSIWKWYSVPSFPFLNAIEIKTASKAGFSVKDIDMPAILEGTSPTVPVLFLISAGDSYILPAWSEAVAAAYAGPQETITGGAAHGTVYADQRAAADAVLARWWAQYGS